MMSRWRLGRHEAAQAFRASLATTFTTAATSGRTSCCGISDASLARRLHARFLAGHSVPVPTAGGPARLYSPSPLDTVRRPRRSPIVEPPGRPAAGPAMTGSRCRPGLGHRGRESSGLGSVLDATWFGAPLEARLGSDRDSIRFDLGQNLGFCSARFQGGLVLARSFAWHGSRFGSSQLRHQTASDYVVSKLGTRLRFCSRLGLAAWLGNRLSIRLGTRLGLAISLTHARGSADRLSLIRGPAWLKSW